MKPNWWKEITWNGLNIPCPNLAKKAAAQICADAEPFELPGEFGWFDWAIPTINQHGPSCCGQAWANWMELMLRRYVGRDVLSEGEQLDGYAIWKRGREMFYGGSDVGGLYLRQGFDAALDLGILPPGSEILTVAPIIDDIFEVLRLMPLVQGHIVHKGWYDPNVENGCIDHSKRPNPGDGGHATVLIANLVKEGRIYMVSQNSWGQEYGWNGYFTMTSDEWFEGWIGDGPVGVQLPGNWTSWEGWKRHITRNAQ